MQARVKLNAETYKSPSGKKIAEAMVRHYVQRLAELRRKSRLSRAELEELRELREVATAWNNIKKG